jgi:hypothetical protein
MDEDRFNMELRKFLKQVGVTSQREIERVARERAGGVARERAGGAKVLRLKMALTSPDDPGLNHIVEAEIALD